MQIAGISSQATIKNATVLNGLPYDALNAKCNLYLSILELKSIQNAYLMHNLLMNHLYQVLLYF